MNCSRYRSSRAACAEFDHRRLELLVLGGRRGVEAAVDEFGRIDILANNAGVALPVAAGATAL